MTNFEITSAFTFLPTLLPLLQLAAVGAVLGAGPLLWWRSRARAASPGERLRALTLLTLFFTFDLIVFGAFTRLSDSGLGCPDWPGCYGHASPLGAHASIQSAQTAMPTGPVTHGKAWIEMVHRYLASGVGVLILVLCVQSWLATRDTQNRARMPSPWWATLTLVWVCLQGGFGALTVTMKLFPAIVTLHLLFGLGLLMLLVWQSESYAPRPLAAPPVLRWFAWAVLVLALVQVALGGWVSTNYAVLACDEFPTCHSGEWWPSLDFAQGFALWRELGASANGGWLSFAALGAIHVAHRLGAMVLALAVLGLAWTLHQQTTPTARRWAKLLLLLLAWQVASGVSNVVLDWPLAAALGHTAGAALLLGALTALVARLHAARALATASTSDSASRNISHAGASAATVSARNSLGRSA